MSFERYVALGDSFTEGVGDPDPARPNGLRGWADLVAGELARHSESFAYANLAIRGRLLRPIVDEQLETAVAMRPDLVTIYAGGNNLMRPKLDLDALAAEYDEAIGKLAATGARILMWTAYDGSWAPVFGMLRGRWAVYNELVREIADRHEATIVDFWRFDEYRDLRMWDFDRLHMSAAGHHNMAIRVLDLLGVEHGLGPVEFDEAPVLTRAQERAADRAWMREFLVPWVGRRLRGVSSGDGITPKYPELGPVRF
ncbi:SGNH/GDSL hydrolase family protein [Rhodococcus rhodochrous]|uniref:SGNH/GDSL hydrolase family protein n=1 Tax=Rhodococcus rhodochrous TaxID=1829 RepID=UPI001E2DB939|nr:SGNH/GDSL hydrolase family protein [Rhodococcus rhodochrous]MCR8691007.1 SGNH/GDSL hydrolase family protein [Rhodococcus pyridinivorans]MCD2096884.1 SGNH/GDSL hydrolase family protein [Rhodococcus rhodochrous]MCD2121585.1 SGNH/GDSL hydrolase family protein [Rhodococcus rhodochrous]MCQ4137036.1 SGNH/GDSL hydrolase family protein [Rhodococcus rhodochrous]MDJ0018448.1 SGNH/GDSL hydrolase family protein [Rhodococcus rhodochrous]